MKILEWGWQPTGMSEGFILTADLYLPAAICLGIFQPFARRSVYPFDKQVAISFTHSKLPLENDKHAGDFESHLA
jgi:hypothetical protein